MPASGFRSHLFASIHSCSPIFADKNIALTGRYLNHETVEAIGRLHKML
jgi:hypothetical protein